MAQLLFILASTGILFAFSPKGMFAVYGCLFLVRHLSSLECRFDGHGTDNRHYVEAFVKNLDARKSVDPADLDADVCREANAALQWLNRRRALDDIPIHGAMCILGFVLLGFCLILLPANSSWGAFGTAGALFTGLNAIYFFAIQFCDWRLNVHMRHACAIWL